MDEQLTFNGFAAAVWAERLRSFYESLPAGLVPERHWDLLLDIAVSAPEAGIEDLRSGPRSSGASGADFAAGRLQPNGLTGRVAVEATPFGTCARSGLCRCGADRRPP